MIVHHIVVIVISNDFVIIIGNPRVSSGVHRCFRGGSIVISITSISGSSGTGKNTVIVCKKRRDKVE